MNGFAIHKIPFRVIHLSFLIFLFYLPPKSDAQGVYNLDVDNGLPTNYAYCMLTDQYGYLWIATQKGVVRYNGYETVLFNYARGLPEEDVWRLYEDKKRRIWLSSISRQIGYIYNNKYRPVFNIANKNLYPREIRDYDSGIFFFSGYQDENNNSQALYMEKNDTVYHKMLDSAVDPAITNNSENILLLRNDSIYFLHPDFDLHQRSYIKKITFLKKHTEDPYLKMTQFGNTILFTRKNDHIIWGTNLYTNDTSWRFDFYKPGNTKEKIQLIFNPDDNYYGKNDGYVIITNKAIYNIDTALRIKKLADISSLTGGAPVTVSFYIHNKLWAQCLSTLDKGIYLNFPTYGQLKKLPANGVSSFKNIGCTADESSYWWNDSTHMLAQVKKNNTVRYVHYKTVNLVKNITSYNKDHSLLISRKFIYLLDNHSLKLTNFIERFRWTYNLYRKVNAVTEWDAYKVMMYASGSFYLLSKAQGVYNFNFRNDSLMVYNVNRDRFNDMAYDSTRRAFCLYNADDIEVYRDGAKICAFTRSSLKAIGIRNIEKITCNADGNIFLKEYDRLLVFNKNMQRYHTLFRNYMLDGASVNVYRNILIIAGKFGVLFSRITGPLKISREIVYRNIKNTSYNYVRDLQVVNDRVFLNTDKGMYEAAIPAAEAFDHNTADNSIQFRLILFYHDTLRAMTQGSLVAIDQKDMKLEFDVINPAGSGKARYEYFIKGIDSGWQESNTGSLLLAQLQPGNTYTLSVRVHDDILKGAPVNIRLYIIPYWWQRPVWVKTFWACGFIILLVFGYSVAFITRKKVIRNNAKKNQLLELELKAIYSQINPHFIYNTLNSALLLIHNEKMKEAYTHVSKFSRLLRAYVRSSRNKYITVGEEIANLKNYIELQQVRFKNKFHYEIGTDEHNPVNDIKIPSLLLQPFVENAINHGLIPKEGIGNLMIQFRTSSENELICIVADDGIGRERSGLLKKNELKESYGDQLVKDLVRIFNTYERMHIEIQYIDKVAPLTGTIVEIRIKTL